MIIAGPCLCTDKNDIPEVLETAKHLHKISMDNNIPIFFRCKLWGGGTTVDKWFPGVGIEGIKILQDINLFLPAGTEIQTENQLMQSLELSFVWIGARNCQNYGLLQYLKNYTGRIMLKRHPSMSINEFIDLYRLVKYLLNIDVMVIERGIYTVNRGNKTRWDLDVQGIIQLRNDEPEMFQNMIVDISHAAGKKSYIHDLYNICTEIGVQHYMIECTESGKSKTDEAHMLSVDEVECLIKN